MDAYFIYSQLFITPAYPKKSFEGQTVIVTGANSGLGFEAVKHFVRLGVRTLILAVRNLAAGEAAKAKIEKETRRTGVIQVWKVDLASYASVKDFAARAARELDRIDVLNANAGINTDAFKLVEEDETNITINVVSTFLMVLLMLPKLEESAKRYNTTPRISITTSEMHAMSAFKERSAPSIFDALNDKEQTNMSERYSTSKLLVILALRHIGPLLARSKNKDVVVNMFNPGFCRSGLARDMDSWGFWLFQTLLARRTEVGGRTLVLAASAGQDSHAQYMSDGMIKDERLIPWVRGPEGVQVGDKVWKELGAKLERISPGVLSNLQ